MDTLIRIKRLVSPVLVLSMIVLFSTLSFAQRQPVEFSVSFGNTYFFPSNIPAGIGKVWYVDEFVSKQQKNLLNTVFEGSLTIPQLTQPFIT